MLVGFFCSSPVATGIDGGGTISSYAGCSYASQRHLQSTRSRLPRQFELAGEFLFQDAAPAMASETGRNNETGMIFNDF
jgi:hypothetical protein